MSGARSGYAICTQPRSGSNLLCQYLSSTGCLGHPLEYFNGTGRRALGLPGFPDDPSLQLEAILQLGATPNQVYAVKVFASQLDAISKSVRWTDALPDLRFVYLTRDDVLGQAISWARALQTAQYRSTQQVGGEATYSADLIQAQLIAILRERAQWEAYFARNGVAPLHIVYERFLEDRALAIRRIAAFVNVPNAVIDERKIDLLKQRDALSEEWRAKFRSERGDLNVLDAI
jgi:LPS sulfotransferase NodH